MDCYSLVESLLAKIRPLCYSVSTVSGVRVRDETTRYRHQTVVDCCRRYVGPSNLDEFGLRLRVDKSVIILSVRSSVYFACITIGHKYIGTIMGLLH